ncbi:MAG: uroporphyrinogen-III synthase [Candidatus Bipolaricaulia bacterium]
MVTVAIFRPKRHEKRSVNFLRSLGFKVISVPLLEIQTTGLAPLTDTDFIIFTSAQGVQIACDRIAAEALQRPTVCAIGPRTAEALQVRGIPVDLVPEEYSSAGMVERLAPRVHGKRVEVARSSAGSKILLQGLNQAGAFVHETVLYRLERPRVDEQAIETVLNQADVLLFTSSLTVDHFLKSSSDKAEVLTRIDEKFVGAIGPLTAEGLKRYEIKVDLVPARSTFEQLVQEMKTAVFAHLQQ